MHNMQDELSGPMTIEFIGGSKLDAIIDHVVTDSHAHPIFLVEGDDTIHNWSTITRVIRK